MWLCIFRAWRKEKGAAATLDKLVFILHIVGYKELEVKVRAIKITSEAIRF